MAKILIITQELTGRVNTFCELGRRLQQAGHEVAVSSPVDIAEAVRTRGLEFRALSRLKPVGEAGEPILRTSPGRALRRLVELRSFRSNRQAEIESLDMAGWIRGLRSVDPDLVLCDFELPMHVIIAGGLGLRVGLLSDQMCLYKRPGVPPLHRNVAPGEGWAGSQAGIEAAWLRYRTWKWLRFQLLRLLSGGRDELTVLAEIARRTGYPLRREVQRYQWSVPITFRSIPVLTLNAFELEFRHTPPTNVHYVGPVVDSQPSTPSATEEDERHLAGLLEDSAHRTLIYGGFGAYHTGDESGFVRRVMEAVGSEPGWNIVIGLGGRASPGELGPVPNNVHLLTWAPQQRVLKRADVAVLHGGITSVNEAISFGVPMVVYPHSYNDTPGYAARIRHHGLGVVGDRASATPEDIHAHIATALRDRGIRSNIGQMQAHFHAYRDRAVEAVEDLLPTFRNQ